MKIKALKSFCGTVTMGIGDIKDVEEKTALGLIGVGYAQSVEEKNPSEETTEEKQGEAATPEGTADAESETAEQPQTEQTNKTSKKAKK